MKKYFFTFLCICIFSSTHAQKQDTVKIGCYIISLHDLDFKQEEYTARFWLWMLHKRPIPKPQDALELPNSKNYTIDNTVADSLEGKGWLQLKINAHMKQEWNLSNFPFDKQVLHIVVENPELPSEELIFVPDTLGRAYDPNLLIEGWKIQKFEVKTSIATYKTSFGDHTSKQETNYSQFLIDITIERSAWGLFIKLFLGMYVAFAISFVTFFIDAEHPEPRFGLPVGGLFAAVGNKYVIDSYLPSTSTLTIVDTLHGLTFIMIFVIIAFSALSLRQEDLGNEKDSTNTDRIVSWTIAIIYVSFNAYAIINAANQ